MFGTMVLDIPLDGVQKRHPITSAASPERPRGGLELPPVSRKPASLVHRRVGPTTRNRRLVRPQRVGVQVLSATGDLRRNQARAAQHRFLGLSEAEFLTRSPRRSGCPVLVLLKRAANRITPTIYVAVSSALSSSERKSSLVRLGWEFCEKAFVDTLRGHLLLSLRSYLKKRLLSPQHLKLLLLRQCVWIIDPSDIIDLERFR